MGTEIELKEAYVRSGLLRIIFNPVLNHGDRSYQSHQAVECAGDQGQFWPFRSYLFENQGQLWRGDIRATVKQLAADFGLSTTDFNACIDEQRHVARIEAQDAIRVQKGINAQPMFDIGGDIYAGSAPFAAFAQIIDSKITGQ